MNKVIKWLLILIGYYVGAWVLAIVSFGIKNGWENIVVTDKDTHGALILLMMGDYVYNNHIKKKK